MCVTEQHSTVIRNVIKSVDTFFTAITIVRVILTILFKFISAGYYFHVESAVMLITWDDNTRTTRVTFDDNYLWCCDTPFCLSPLTLTDRLWCSV